MIKLQSIKKFLAFLSVITFILSPAHAQKSESRLFSFTFSNGISLASNGGFPAGNVDIASSLAYTAGGSFQYAVSPRWSIEGAFHSGKFSNKFVVDPDFTNRFFAISFRGIGNLNQLLNLKWSKSNVINPFISFGMGFIRSSIDAEDFEANDFALSFMAGPGVSLFLNRWSDFFIQYDYHFPGTDLLDSVSNESGSDKYALLKAGFRINFGKGNQRHPSWPSPRYPVSDTRVADVKNVEESEEDTQEEEEISTDTKDESKVKLRWLTNFSNFYHALLLNQDLLADMRTQIETRKAEIEAERRERRKAEQQAEGALTENVPDGQYIQIRSIGNRQEAIDYRTQVISDLNDLFENPSERVLITPFEQTFRILIGPFQNYSQARNMRNLITDKYEGSFIITYPRQSDVKAAADTPVPDPEPEPQPVPEPEEEERPVVEDSPPAVIVESVPDGQYIQIRSIGNRQEAIDYRSAVIQNLSGVIDNPQEQVVITPFQQTFRILIGPFQSVSEARAVQRRTANLFEGSFVITYPRQDG